MRGVSHEQASLDAWGREAAPSPELRDWYGHQPHLFDDSRTRYLDELTQPGPAEAPFGATTSAGPSSCPRQPRRSRSATRQCSADC
ncbi:DUF488 family protein, N3 subclade [Rugosimonospora acidiphila]|uniref:DUF488 family protein, N3 subclade n=1 Tax=Rugosimonospora acidiphila TaxID=556531 RepID=UPI003CD0BFA1